jgi:hypothetical protein
MQVTAPPVQLDGRCCRSVSRCPIHLPAVHITVIYPP